MAKNVTIAILLIGLAVSVALVGYLVSTSDPKPATGAVPARPAEPTVTRGENSLTLSWSAVAGAGWYHINVQRANGSGDWTRYESVGTSTTIHGLDCGAVYVINFRALNAHGAGRVVGFTASTESCRDAVSPDGKREAAPPHHGETPVAGAADGPPSWRTLDLVIARDELRCGVKQTQPLFGFREAGTVVGFDIEFCKALAAAVLDDHTKVEYVDASSASTRFELLAEEEIDVLIRTTTITASRDRELAVDFAQTTFYTGQGFAVRTDSGIDSTSDMGDAIICVQAGTPTEQNVADHFTDIGLEYDPQGGLSADVAAAFFDRRCDVLTGDAFNLASRIAVRRDAADYTILPQIISKEPLAPGVRDYDSEWKDVVNWVVHGLIRAEELGITQANVAQMAANPPNAEVARLLGVPFQGSDVATLGFDSIDAQFIQRAIAAVGNYGEIYAREIGDIIPRACTLNDLVINNSGCPDGQGGIMYALPYR